jgi:long-chain acyl-CoA synthetase
MIWTAVNVGRIVLDTAGRILQTPHAGLPATVSPTLDLHRDLGLDSLQRMALAASLNEFFGLFNTSADNYLLADTSLAHWTACILRARQQYDDAITFRTSGTGGAAKATRHSLTSLLIEARFLAELLPRPAQVVSTVSAQHIYGFIFTVLLPSLWACPLRLLSDVSVADLGPDTLLIGTPFTWEFLQRSIPPGATVRCQGVSSTAPMPPGLFAQLLDAGVSLTEVYGSSDTGGLGYRQTPDAPFALFPYLTLLPGDPAQVAHANTGATYDLPDRIERVSARAVRVLGRLDEAIQVAGVNVYPAHIRQVILDCPLVADCDVYAKATAGISQLYGAVRLRTLNEANREACLRWIRERLTAPETPAHLYIY